MTWATKRNLSINLVENTHVLHKLLVFVKIDNTI